MTAIHHRRLMLQSGLAASLAWLAPPARACEFFTTTLRVLHPWTSATPPQADTAVVAMTFDEVSQDDRLIGLSTPVARGVELVGNGLGPALDLAIPAGASLELHEAGTHLRLVGLLQPLQVGRSYPLRLLFAQGGPVNASLSVDQVRFT